MAVKTFKTRIKSKYDLSTNWANFDSALPGEILLGSDDKYIRIGKEDGGWDWAKMSADNVDINSYSNGQTTISTAQAAISDLNTRINAITGGAVVTSFGGKTGTITVAGPLSMNSNELTIATASNEQLGVVKVTNGNGLILTDGTITMGLANDTTAGAMTSAHYTKLDGIAAGAQVNKIETVKVNGTGLTPDDSKAVNIIITEGDTNGTVKVNNTDVAVHGLGSAAYTDSGNYATHAQGEKADKALQSISKGDDGTYVTTTVSEKGEGTTQTVGVSVTTKEVANATSTDNGLATAADVKSYVDGQITNLTGALIYEGVISTYPTPVPEGAQKGSVYVVSQDFTHEGETYEAGDMFIYNGASWNVVNGENQVSATADGAVLTAGGDAVVVATVDGTQIPVKVQVTAGTAIIAKNVDGVVTLKAGVTQSGTSGTIENNIEGDITLAKVATTGAAEDVTIKDTDNKFNATTVEGALTEIAGNVKTNADNINTLQNTVNNLNVDGKIETAIQGLDSEVSAEQTTQGTTPSGDFKVLEKVSIEDGKLVPGSSAAVNLKKLAATANVNDVEQTTGDIIIFDCGSASVNTQTA